MKIETNSHISQVGTVVFIQNFSNRKICFASLVVNQTHTSFHFHEVFWQNSLKAFIKKLKD